MAEQDGHASFCIGVGEGVQLVVRVNDGETLPLVVTEEDRVDNADAPAIKKIKAFTGGGIQNFYEIHSNVGKQLR